jgi:hypothetical protein
LLKLLGGVSQPHDIHPPLKHASGRETAGDMSAFGVQGLLVKSLFEVQNRKHLVAPVFDQNIFNVG